MVVSFLPPRCRFYCTYVPLSTISSPMLQYPTRPRPQPRAFLSTFEVITTPTTTFIYLLCIFIRRCDVCRTYAGHLALREKSSASCGFIPPIPSLQILHKPPSPPTDGTQTERPSALPREPEITEDGYVKNKHLRLLEVFHRRLQGRGRFGLFRKLLRKRDRYPP